MLGRCVRSLVKTKVARGYAKVSWKTVLDSRARTEARLLASEQRIVGVKNAIKAVEDSVKNVISQLKKDVQANKADEDKLPELIKVAVQATNKDMFWKGVYGSGVFFCVLSLWWEMISAVSYYPTGVRYYQVVNQAENSWPPSRRPPWDQPL